MRKKTEAVSDFAKSRTLKEQREYLPIYHVREELMTVRYMAFANIAFNRIMYDGGSPSPLQC